ncbi:MAG: type I methionyl aminopeptidase [Candidatus Doudnabacteria bacterium RIFCSPHIGHO2_01_FULL_50_67]|uniref:Methionine aminopeptidase n=1 Tax=Candidatus Doudnabacteria bacterium RIFCSPHIGHO2_12_FULL_48_16 TaxID=1817838 RepID=A0A1F5PJ77_9BACT|nr:MAG: type I methionyl aminopeptidase [Candidatus Doudnabacteria bacterium RIFCSPHIGHO2_02_FULL_49_24]OGE89876.1 MAG: type I methionyl aminopeptidase [Candidatus Doudnabacteria bacterium RIFCSPHIGHO2_01_FULL_50_67]OGE89993.1 MAG: type I methionyl aminopeptidase [Candidatus Doudnabacteria bacterium RIFCSPHIGHO2_12_FULL_48_16]OGE97462.1 MAG: type I methionyl aminopeptidase [Candidatus Doudnabacteria bacterium RIFCSPLOWO2_01_FULL_49_40]
MITHDPKQIELLRQSGQILARTLKLVARRVAPGVSAYELNQLAEEEISKAGAVPAFKNYKSSPDDKPFPATLCVSVNDEVVHGIPAKNKILKNGDIVGLDLGVNYQGFFTDAAITVPVGQVDKQSLKLIEAATECLKKAIEQVAPGKTTGDVGFATESAATRYGFQVVRNLVGHGVGAAVHEEPEIPGFGKKGVGTKLVEGMVIAVEPMVNAGDWAITFDPDGWTIRTADGSRSAHMEHTLLVTATGCDILTA